MSTSVLFVLRLCYQSPETRSLSQNIEKWPFLLLLQIFLFFEYYIGKTPVNGRTSVTITSLNASPLYVFASALDKCNATLAVSHTLTTDGQRRSCSAVNVPHSTVPGTHQMEPASPIQALGVNPFPSGFIIRTIPWGSFAR